MNVKSLGGISRIVCLSFFYVGNLAAQNPAPTTEINVIPPSPNVTAFNKFVEIPVSYYTGTSQISIPLYEIKLNQLSLPISLEYHASGLRVQEQASWVGAGWTLNAGGVISRTVKGLPDELNLGGKKGMFYNTRVFASNGNLNVEVDNCTPSQNVLTSADPYTTPDSISRGLLDVEPDLFHFSFPGGSGKFAFTHLHSLVKLTVDDTKIDSHPFSGSPTLPTTLSSDYEWIITGDDGVQYKFKNAEKTRVTSYSPGSFSPYSPTFEYYQSAWHLDEISYNGEWIKFYHASEYLEYNITHSEFGQFKVAGNGSQNSTTVSSIDTDVDAKRLSRIETSNGYKIFFDASSQSRNDLAGSKRLSYVRVLKDGVTIMRYQINNNAYFGTNAKLKLESVIPAGLTDSTQTLNGYKLEYYSGQVPAVSSNSQDYWGYNNGATNASLLPPFADDTHHVNVTSTANRNPNLSSCQAGALKKIIFPTGGSTELEYELHSYYGVDRHPYYYQATASGGSQFSPVVQTANFTAGHDCSVTILEDPNPQEILTYRKFRKFNNSTELWEDYMPSANPTGNRHHLPAGTYQLYVQNANGGTTFLQAYYEQLDTTNISAGGLRIKNLIFYDPVSNKKNVKSFQYTTGQIAQSSGVLFTPNILGGNITTHTPGSLVQMACVPSSGGSFLNVSSTTQVPLAIYSGSHIGYSEVKVFDLEEASLGQTITNAMKTNGMVTYNFENQKDARGYAYPFVPQEDYGYKNGKSLKEEWFKWTAAGLRKIKSVENTYTTSTEEFPYKVKGVNFKKVDSHFCFHCTGDFASNAYTLQPTWHRLISKVERHYDDNEQVALASTTTLSYQPSATHTQLEGQTTQNSLNETITENYVRGVSGKPKLVTEVIQYTAGIRTGGSKVSYNGKLPTHYYIWNTQLGAYEQRTLYTYDNNKLTNRIDLSGTGQEAKGLQKSYVWGHQGAFVLAEVINAAPDKIFYTSFEENGTAGNAKTGDKYWNSGTFNFSTNGNFTPTATTDLLISYWYWNGTAWLFKEVVWTASISDGTRLDEIRVYPKGSSMTTFTHKIGVGISSATDPNNNTTYYRYDNFGRLQYIEDDKHNVIKKITYQQYTTN